MRREIEMQNKMFCCSSSVEMNESGDRDNLCLCQLDKYGYAQNAALLSSVKIQSAESALPCRMQKTLQI